jgi:hypothetical protein
MAPTGDHRAPAWFDVVEDQGYTLVGGEGGNPVGLLGP